MASKKKLLQAAAGSAVGASLDVDDCFSCHLYEGTGSAQTITNGIDLSGEGGLVWFKNRDYAFDHALIDTARGTSKYLNSASTGGSNNISGFTSFNNNGFTISTNEDKFNYSSAGYNDYVSWTFRKAPKFFDVVTYTGNGVAGRQISHNLGSAPGMMFIKATNQAYPWRIYHRSQGATKVGRLDENSQFSTAQTFLNNTEPTSSVFTLGDSAYNNGSNVTYIAYLFAHNDGDGEFGPDADQDIIKCGSYTGTGAKLDINLGFEAQWVMVKRTDTSGYDWHIFDVMRGMPVGSDAFWLEANTSNPEANNAYMSAHPTGFTLPAGHPEVCANGGNYIYMAIRRGPLAAPTDATKVFEPVAYSGSGNTGNVIGNINRADLVIVDDRNNDTDLSSYGATVFDRLRGSKALKTNSTSADEGGWTTYYIGLDQSNGWRTGNTDINYLNKASRNYISWAWKRAPGYFDVVAYDGSNSNSTINHNLGVAPEMIWVKRRDVSSGHWRVFIPSLSGILKLNGTDALDTSNAKYYFGDNNNIIAPTATQFTVTPQTGNVNTNSSRYIAYLFATLAGVSKVGSVSLTGSAINVDCGFSSGARFVLLKRTDSTSAGWWVWDSARGIVSGNDPYLELNTTSAEVTNTDYIDPFASGFTITNNFYSSGTWIFYAIA